MDTPASSRANSLRHGPDSRGKFGGFGGRFVAETLMPLILEVEQAYNAAKADPKFQPELDAYLTPDATRIMCSWHGAVFRIADGHCEGGPCMGARLTPWPVRVEDGVIVTDA